jgi:serine/threonine protein phosphatase 1
MKYFAFSDVHGDYDALMRAVAEYGYEPQNPNHTLLSCGDNFGRAETGKGSKGIYAYLTSAEHKNKPICLTGNHELILKDILFRRGITVTDIFNGEDKTVYSFLGKSGDADVTAYEIDELSRSPLMDWLLSLPYYFETKNHIFLHGFLPYDYEMMRFYPDLSKAENSDWVAACWAQTPTMIEKFVQEYPRGMEKTVVFGHWHNAQLKRAFDETVDKNTLHSLWRRADLRLCGLDCCAYLSHKIEMLVVEE